jgi:hypothetical protein
VGRFKRGLEDECVKPGILQHLLVFTVVSKVVLPFLKTPAQGAQMSIYLASSPNMDGVTGEFFANGKPKTANKVAYDTDMTARLWNVSADLVGMTSAIP